MATGWVFHGKLYLWHDNAGAYAAVFPPSLTIKPGSTPGSRDQAPLPAISPEVLRQLLDQLHDLEAASRHRGGGGRFSIRPTTSTTSSRSAQTSKAACRRAQPFGRGRLTETSRACFRAPAAPSPPWMRCVTGKVRNAYALVRPPGHHAIRDKGVGFCCLRHNVAIAIMHARAVHKLGKIATVVLDVHHGNGTQQAFYEDHVRAHDLHSSGSPVPATRRRRGESGQARARLQHQHFRCRPARASAPTWRPSEQRAWCRP